MRISNEILSIKEAGKKDVDFLFNLRNKKYVYKYSKNALYQAMSYMDSWI